MDPVGMINLSGWWLTNPSEQWWSSSVVYDEIPINSQYMQNKYKMFQTTSVQCVFVVQMLLLQWSVDFTDYITVLNYHSNPNRDRTCTSSHLKFFVSRIYILFLLVEAIDQYPTSTSYWDHQGHWKDMVNEVNPLPNTSNNSEGLYRGLYVYICLYMFIYVYKCLYMFINVYICLYMFIFCLYQGLQWNHWIVSDWFEPPCIGYTPRHSAYPDASQFSQTTGDTFLLTTGAINHMMIILMFDG